MTDSNVSKTKQCKRCIDLQEEVSVWKDNYNNKFVETKPIPTSVEYSNLYRRLFMFVRDDTTLSKEETRVWIIGVIIGFEDFEVVGKTLNWSDNKIKAWKITHETFRGLA